MAGAAKLKETFDVAATYGAFYTGGNVEWLEDTLYCQTQANISLLNIEDGRVGQIVGEEYNEDADFIQTFTTDGNRIVSSHKSGLIKLWNSNGELVKAWKYIHKGPVARLRLGEGDLLGSGGADGGVRIWHLEHNTCTLSLKGCQGVVNVLEFNKDEIYGSGDDGKLLCWSATYKGQLLHVYQGHFSKITSLHFFNAKNKFVTCGRDKVIILWAKGQTGPLKTIPLLEAVESIVKLPMKFTVPGFKATSDGIYVASAGEFGQIRIWDVENTKEIYKQEMSLISKATEEGGLAITHLLCNDKRRTLAIISVDHNILLYHLKSFVCLKQFVGFSDEILDITFVGKNDSHIAVATNSCDIKLYETEAMNCRLLKGHSDIVLTLNCAKNRPQLFASAGKDNQIRLWHLDSDLNEVRCVAVGMRHTASIGCIAFAQSECKFLTSSSNDTCLKIWDIPVKFDNATGKPLVLDCRHTEIAHKRDINCVAVSPNDKIIATASQDKTAKLWTDSLGFLGSLKGHKRGVWSIRFSPIDQVVATSSADCTIKLWSIVELNCLKTFEGHESSVLKCDFITNGLQILTAGADGLLKLFNIKNSVCITTMEQHDGRIWALAIRNDESGFITGGSDSKLIKWIDVTEIKRLEKFKENEQLLLEEQKLNNFIHNDELLKALKLALKLNRPYQVLKIIQGVIKKGDAGLIDTICELNNDEKENLFKCSINWNTNSRNSHEAQLIINILINQLKCNDFKPINLKNSIENALPYTERHLKRLTTLMQNLYLINYTINCMKPHMKNN